MKKIFAFFLIYLLFICEAHAAEYGLRELFRHALDNAEIIKISEENLRIQEAGKEKAVSALIPKASVFGSVRHYSGEKTSLAGQVIQPRRTSTYGAKVEQSLSLGGKEFTALRVSADNIKRAEYDLYALKEEHLFSVASAYYDALGAKKAVEIARANVERLKKHRDGSEVRLRVGEVTKTVLLRAEAELSGALSQLVSSENGFMLSKAILGRIAAIEGDYELKETEEETAENAQELSLSALKGDAFGERADIKAAELQRNIALDEVRLRKAAYWPALSIEGVYSRTENEPSSAFSAQEALYGGLNLTFTVFDGGLRRADVGEAGARLRQAELRLEDLKRAVSVEVEEAYLDLRTQRGVLKSLEDQLRFAAENFTAVSKQFQYGLATSLDVIDANTLLVTAERQLADALFNYRVASLKLKKSTGTLLKAVLLAQPSK